MRRIIICFCLVLSMCSCVSPNHQAASEPIVVELTDPEPNPDPNPAVRDATGINRASIRVLLNGAKFTDYKTESIKQGVRLLIPVPEEPGEYRLQVFASDVAGNKMHPIDTEFVVRP